MAKHVFRTREELRHILEVYEECGGVNETARRTKIPTTTVQRFIAKYQTAASFDAEYEGKGNCLALLPCVNHISQCKKSIFIMLIC